MNDAFLSLGSNEGDRKQWFRKAIDMIGRSCGEVVELSSVYETAAWGITTQPDFLNMVIHVKTDLTPHDLLNHVLAIEIELGRKREIKWGPRIIDIDILLYNYEIINTADLIVPHPFLQDRRFTLIPLAEIIPSYIHPKLNNSIWQLLTECPDQLDVRMKGQLNS
ncbi:MAG: folK [Flavipsychrobacter sp.]|nr:folK [Flavipsychrobacter sp.]